jgi:hypothetical protein
MTYEERIAAFDAIRRRASAAREAIPADPLAVALPEKRSVPGAEPAIDYDDEGPPELSEDEIQRKFEELRSAARESSVRGASSASRRPSEPKSTGDLRLAMIALKVEHERYAQEAKRCLQEHQENVRDIFYKYGLDLD